MNENKRREWVKNAIIIFLIVMLLLTFFSNTIMNYSLPEVSARYVESGTLSEQIRGSGEVKANQTYEVKMGETRKIASVEVQAGDTVEKGQVIYKLEDSESDELAAAEKNLKSAKKAYDEAMLTVGVDYRTDELDIANQEEDLDRLRAELPKISGYNSAYEKAKDKVKDIEAEIKGLEKDSKEYNDILTAIAEEDYASLSAADYAKITKAKEDLDAAEKAKAETEKKIQEYESNISAGGDQSAINAAQKAIEEKKLAIEKATNDLIFESSEFEPDMDVINSLKSNIEQYKLDLKYLQQDYSDLLSQSSTYNRNKQFLNSAKSTLESDEKKYDTAKKTLDDLIASIKKDAKTKINSIQDKIDEANERLEQAKTERDEAGEKASLTTEEQEDKIREAETALEKAKIALSNKKRDDAVTAGKDALHIQELQDAVDDADAEVQKLKKNSIGAEITAPVGGKIAALSFVAGEEAAKDAVAASIEMSEKGYTLEITVSVEQSKKVKVGDEAEIQYFWYGDAAAKLVSITVDQSNPARNRILTFSVTGDITPGQNLQISMGSKGQRYEYIVPNSAVREDNNGKFILAVRSKSSPLGNRYMAERIDVEVLASDDTSSAISGDIFGGDYIITTATAPISAGDQVRLVEN